MLYVWLTSFVSEFMYLSRIDVPVDAVDEIQKDEFARTYPLLDDVAVHAQWKNGPWHITRIGDIWKRTGKILSVPYEGAEAYPSFQFAKDGTPLPLMEKVLQALPSDMTAWQRAFWMTSAKKELGGEFPANCIRAGDDRVVDVADMAGAALRV